MKRQEPLLVFPKKVTMLCRCSVGDPRPATSAPTDWVGRGVPGVTRKEMGLRPHHLLDHRAGSVFKENPMCFMATDRPTAAFSRRWYRCQRMRESRSCPQTQRSMPGVYEACYTLQSWASRKPGYQGYWSDSIDTACHSWGRLPFHGISLAQNRCSANIVWWVTLKSAWCCQDSNLSLCSEDRRAWSSVAWEKHNIFPPGLGDSRSGWWGKAVTIHDHQKSTKMCVMCGTFKCLAWDSF